MFAMLIFILILLLIIGLIYGVSKLKQRSQKTTPLVIGLYILILCIACLWLYYGFLFLTIIMRGV